MYASAMKFCGAAELCGIGHPRSEPMDYQWPDILAQVAAQKAGLIVAITREQNEQEARLMKDKGFAAVYKFTNPRTGNVGVLWIKDMTGTGGPVTKLPDYVTAPSYPDPMPVAETGYPRLRLGQPTARGAVQALNAQIDAMFTPPPSSWAAPEPCRRVIHLDSEHQPPYTGGVGEASSPSPRTEPAIY